MHCVVRTNWIWKWLHLWFGWDFHLISWLEFWLMTAGDEIAGCACDHHQPTARGSRVYFFECISQMYFSTVFLNCIFELIRRRQVPGATRRGVGGANLTKASEPRCDCSSDSFGRLTTPCFRQHCSCSHSALDREENLQSTNFLAPNDGSAGNVRGWTSVLLAYFCLGCFFGHKPIDYQPKWSSISAWVLYSSRF